jgi:hypothetical protein
MQRKDKRGNPGRNGRRKSLSNVSFKRFLGPRVCRRGLRGSDHSSNKIFRLNSRYARTIWGELCPSAMSSLKNLSDAYGLSIPAGDLQLLDGKWYITHIGLLAIANRSACSAITTSLDHSASEPSISRWVFKATVYKARQSRGFVGYGDANPANTSPLVRGAEMRVAETRAVNRALRKAYGIGLCSVEELGSFSAPQKPLAATRNSNGHPRSIGSSNCQPRLRDQLCVLIRQHNLDSSLVKAYAADFCGTATLKEASRDLVETFVSTLADEASKDRAALVCKLNSYSPQPEEVNS